MTAKTGLTATTVVVITIVSISISIVDVVVAVVVGKGGGVGQEVRRGGKERWSDVAHSLWLPGHCQIARDVVHDLLLNDALIFNGSMVQWFIAYCFLLS